MTINWTVFRLVRVAFIPIPGRSEWDQIWTNSLRERRTSFEFGTSEMRIRLNAEALAMQKIVSFSFWVVLTTLVIIIIDTDLNNIIDVKSKD